MQNQLNDDFVQQLLSLPYDQRDQLAHTLINSLHPKGEAVDDTQWREAWVNECGRRAAEIESGKVPAIPADEAIAMMRSKHGE